MLKYLLDTNIVIYTMKNRPQQVKRRFQQHHGQMGISAVTYLNWCLTRNIHSRWNGIWQTSRPWPLGLKYCRSTTKPHIILDRYGLRCTVWVGP
jgi:hypothetical protein